jgi:DNA-binding transcriptional regulator YhcF (GntR family)
MQLQVDRDSDVPVSTQLAWRLRSAIERGELGPGDRLPSLRDAAAEAGVNVNTVRAVYAKLEAAGVVSTEQGRGTFVTPEAPADDESRQRRNLRDEIARLESELVRLPLIPRDAPAGPKRGAPGARLLSVEELAAVRDVLAERVTELHAARAEIVERLAAGPHPASDRSAPSRSPARRSSSSLAGARVRWTGA